MISLIVGVEGRSGDKNMEVEKGAGSGTSPGRVEALVS